MAILQSCCFWKNVRKGSYASAIYTMVYFGMSCLILARYISDEQEYLRGDVDKPKGESVLERGNISPTTVVFNIFFLGCSFCIVLASLMVIFGLRHNQRYLLLPWIFFMIADILIEFSHLIYLSTVQTLTFDPVVGVLFTMDFFIMCLNSYCLLCVVSQFQEYRNGRGYSEENQQLGAAHVIRQRLERDLPSTTCLSQNRRAIVSPYMYQHTNISTILEEPDKNNCMENIDKDHPILEFRKVDVTQT